MNNRYSLRRLDSANLSDVERMNLMYLHPRIMKAKGYWEPHSSNEDEIDLTYVDKQIFSTSALLTKKHADVFLAVADFKNMVVGWIWFYVASIHSLPQRIRTELKITTRNARVYQLSYEKLLSEAWPMRLVAQAETITMTTLRRERRGVIVSGLHKALAQLKRTKKRLDIRSKRLILYAYTYPGNIASEKVLLQNAFTKYPRKYSYGGELHNFWLKIL